MAIRINFAPLIEDQQNGSKDLFHFLQLRSFLRSFLRLFLRSFLRCFVPFYIPRPVRSATTLLLLRASSFVPFIVRSSFLFRFLDQACKAAPAVLYGLQLRCYCLKPYSFLHCIFVTVHSGLYEIQLQSLSCGYPLRTLRNRTPIVVLWLSIKDFTKSNSNRRLVAVH